MSIPIIYYPKDSLDSILSRTQLGDDNLTDKVRAIVNDVKNNGDEALIRYTKQFDNIDISQGMLVTDQEIKEAYERVNSDLLVALRKAIENVLEYHKRQVIESNIKDKVGWIMRPIEKAGIYVPGGTAAYPSSVLMCALPAKAAGVEEIIMTTPRPENPLTLVAAKECGIDKIFKIGGAQAISAMAYGTKSVPKVDIIAGPGNIFVTLAKKEVFGHVAIDMIAGPSEILIIADDSANYKYVIADMLSQSEHDKMSASILITTSQEIADKVSQGIIPEAKKLSRNEITLQSLKDNCAIIKVNSLDEAIEISDQIAPEHLELAIDNAQEYAFKVRHAGAIFIGNYSPEPLGDYYAGPSHVLPTSGTARHFSVLNTLTFMKRISLINYDKDNFMEAKDDIIKIAECEGLEAHALSIKVRK